MSPQIDATHAPQLRSWVESANDPACDFPLQNLPFGRFCTEEADSRSVTANTTVNTPWRIGVAIGDQVLDLQAAGLIDSQDMARCLRMPPAARQALRHALSQGLAWGSPESQAPRWQAALRPQAQVRMGLPCDIGDYTDFYTSIHHATTVGKQFRPDNPLLPNYQWVPIGYHGRASTIDVSRPGLGHTFNRPRGQIKAADQAAPQLLPSAKLDFELELGLFIGQPNAPGQPIAMADAPAHLFGLGLFNDWSARDIQAWEYQPLGPFLAKNFASTLSPWIVTMEALAPFHSAFTRAATDPQPLPYLDAPGHAEWGAIDIALEVWLETAAMRAAGLGAERISSANYRDAYWTAAQLVAHHTVNGCALRPGDLLGTGTLSGPTPAQAGSLLELSHGGKQPLHLGNGQTRSFLEDGDTIILRGYCQREGFRRIGLGECRGTVLAATPSG